MRKPRALATQAAKLAGKFGRANLAATVTAKEEGKKVAYTYINNAQDEIFRAMDIVPGWGENFAGVCSAKRDAEKYLQKAENERYRLVWGAGLPSWFALSDFQYFNDKGAVFPVEVTYRNAEKIERLDLPKASDPLEHIAWRWIRMWTLWYDKARKRRGSLPKVERIIEYMEDYGCDGVVFQSAFSCRSWHAGIVQQAQVLNKVYGDVPTLIMEGDIIDISAYNEVDTHNRIDAFIEALAARTERR
jgi:hypothetical protein